MPCEVIPCIVNNTSIVWEPRANNLESRAMHETKTKVEQENSIILTKSDLRRRKEKYHSGSSYGKAPEGHTDMLQNNLTYRHRILPRPFSLKGDFDAVIEECEPTTNVQLGESSNWFSRCRIQNCEPPRRYSTSSWPSGAFMRENRRSRELISQRTHRRRQSEGFITSENKVFGLIGYMNESECILDEQRSDNHNSNTNVLKRERPEWNKTSPNISVVSFDIMSSVATLEQPKSYHSLPRKLSDPVKSHGNDIETTNNGKEQRNSLPTNVCLRQYHFDSDTELQWQSLVARAKTLQLTSPPRRTPEIICSGLADKRSVQMSQKTSTSAGDSKEGVNKLNSKERRTYEYTPFDKDNNNNQQSQRTRMRRRNEERRYSLKMVPTLRSLGESQAKANSDDNLTDDERHEMKHYQDFNKPVVSEQRCIVSPLENSSRRHSVAVVRPVQHVKERLSGYSTHGALEYAKMLMEKIQEEAKTKSKKERLEEMSKVLKLVLEELNRIELPDRDLVSLFISLRAKMVNLRTELKADEGENLEKEMRTEKQTGEKKEILFNSNELARPASSYEEGMPTHPRRFSWI